MALVSQVSVIQARHWEQSPEPAFILFQDEHDSVGLTIWEGFEKDAADNAENGGIGSDSEGHRDNDHGGESRPLPKASRGKPDIFHHVHHVFTIARLS